MTTNNAIMSHNNQQVLFTLTEPELPSVGVITKENRNDKNRLTGIVLAPQSRKIVAAGLNLTMNKDNAAAIDQQMLRAKDAIKTAGIGEIAKLAASPNWTGAKFSMAFGKNGKKKATFALESVSRDGGKVSEDQLVKALAGLSDDAMNVLLQKAEEAKVNMFNAAKPVTELAEVARA